VPNGVRVPGTKFVLDPVKGAWDIGAIIRWLDFNDTWLAAEWDIHPIIWEASYLLQILCRQRNLASGKIL